MQHKIIAIKTNQTDFIFRTFLTRHFKSTIMNTSNEKKNSFHLQTASLLQQYHIFSELALLSSIKCCDALPRQWQFPYFFLYFTFYYEQEQIFRMNNKEEHGLSYHSYLYRDFGSNNMHKCWQIIDEILMIGDMTKWFTVLKMKNTIFIKNS